MGFDKSTSKLFIFAIIVFKRKLLLIVSFI